MGFIKRKYSPIKHDSIGDCSRYKHLSIQLSLLAGAYNNH
jgi:hypothetical protein